MNILREKISEAIQHLSQAGALVDAGCDLNSILDKIRDADRFSYAAQIRAQDIALGKIKPHRLQHLMPGNILTGDEEQDYRILRDLWSAMVGAAEAGLLAERPHVKDAMEDIVLKWGKDGIYRNALE